MIEFFDLLFHPLANAIMTILTSLTALYWVFTFLAGDFLGNLDFGVDFDTDIDVDADVDIDGADAGADLNWMQKTLQFLNVGKVPFMVVFSVFKFIAWIGTLISSIAFDTFSWGWKSILLLIPIFFITIFLTKWATKPLIKIYKQMGYNGEDSHDFIGRVAIMRSVIAANKIGIAELTINKDVIKLNVQSKDGSQIDYNQEVTIIDELKGKNIFLVQKEITLNNF